VILTTYIPFCIASGVGRYCSDHEIELKVGPFVYVNLVLGTALLFTILVESTELHNIKTSKAIGNLYLDLDFER